MYIFLLGKMHSAHPGPARKSPWDHSQLGNVSNLHLHKPGSSGKALRAAKKGKKLGVGKAHFGDTKRAPSDPVHQSRGQVAVPASDDLRPSRAVAIRMQWRLKGRDAALRAS